MTSTQLQPSPPVNCPEWCTQHWYRDAEYPGGPTGSHRLGLFYSHPPANNEVTAIALDVAQVVYGDGDLYEPSMGMSIFAVEPPAGVSPAEARRLAAALIRGAEIVEACLTETCRTCQGKITPREAEEAAGACSLCQLTARRELRAAMKVAL